LLQLQTPLARFTQLADRVILIADYLAHSTAHVSRRMPLSTYLSLHLALDCSFLFIFLASVTGRRAAVQRCRASRTWYRQ
jgi:hypothetical protein